MLKSFLTKANPISVSCAWLISTIALANAPASVDVPPGELVAALEVLADQADLNLVYQPDQLRDLKTQGLKGNYSGREAVEILLRGTALRVYATEEGAMVIAPPLSDKDVIDRAREHGMRVAQEDSSRNVEGSPDVAQRSNNQGLNKMDDSAAQSTSSSRIQEIVVTAQRREERAIDIPMSITALSGDELDAAGIKNALDLSFAVPSLSVMETGPGRQIIAIRGISGIRGTSSLTGIYLDEMPVSGMQDGRIPAYADLRVIDLDRVEVLKGPQGTLFGEGAAGGVIRFITKDPDLTGLGGSVSTELSNTTDGGWGEQVSGILNLPLVKDVFGIRIAATYENNSGWIDQPAGIPPAIAPPSPDPTNPLFPPGGPIGQASIGREDINDSEVKHVRVKALYAPTAALRIKGLAEIHRNEGGASNIVNQVPFRDGNFVQAYDRNAPTNFTDDYDMFNLAVTYDFGFAQLLSSTSYAKLDSVQSEAQLIDAEPVPWLEVLLMQYLHHATITSQEFRFASTSDGPINWQIGANYKEADLIAGGGDTGLDAVVLGGVLALTRVGAGSRPQGASTTWAGFVDGSYEFANRLEVGGGLRYFSDERESFDRVFSPDVVLASDATKTTYRAFVKYAPSQNTNVYLNVGTGFRAGAPLSPEAIAKGSPDSYGPENAIFYELGTKLSLLNGRIRLASAAFHGKYKDMIADKLIQSPVDGSLLQYPANGQSAEVTGIELDLGWAVTERLTLALAGDVTDTEVTEIDPADPIPIYYQGGPINLVPKYSVSASADYGFQWSDSVPGFFRLSFDRKGESYWTDVSNTLQLERQDVSPPVNFLNASVGAKWNDWRWSLTGRNLLNERDPLSATLAGYQAQARPRTISIGISKEF